MNNFVKILLKIYQSLFPSVNRNCRFTPTCSKYFVDALEKHGTAKGTYLGVLRLLSCHPLSKKPFYDPA